MEDHEKWFTDQERKFLWRELEAYLEEEEWSEILAEHDGVPFDPAVVKSAWVKLDRFDKQGPIGLTFTEQEQALLWALLRSYIGAAGGECSRDFSEPDHDCNDDCPSYHDLVTAIILKLPAPALQHNRMVALEKLIASLDRLVFPNPGETTEDYIARVQALHAQRLQKETEQLAALEKMLKATK